MIHKKVTIALLTSALFLVLIAGVLWQTGYLPPSPPPEKINVGSIPARISGPIYIALEKGFFKARGLDVNVRANVSSPESIKELKAGRLDLACCGTFNLTKEALAGARDIRCLAVLCNGQIMDIIARGDRGIDRLEDLRGKSIGLLRGTAAEYFLGRVLTFHQIALKAVKIVDIKPADLGAALAAGKVDALVAWEPYLSDILNKIDGAVVTWPGQERQDIYWLLVGNPTYLQKNPAAAEKFLGALDQAVTFIEKVPAQAREIIHRYAKCPTTDWEKYPLRYKVYLDQGLLLNLDDEAAWMIQNRLTDRTEIPDFMDYIDPGPLLKVNPKEVRLTLPVLGKGR